MRRPRGSGWDTTHTRGGYTHILRQKCGGWIGKVNWDLCLSDAIGPIAATYAGTCCSPGRLLGLESQFIARLGAVCDDRFGIRD